MWLFSEEDKSCFSTDRSLKSLDSGLTEARSSLDMSGRGPIVDMGGGQYSGGSGGGEEAGKHQLSTSQSVWTVG